MGNHIITTLLDPAQKQHWQGSSLSFLEHSSYDDLVITSLAWSFYCREFPSTIFLVRNFYASSSLRQLLLSDTKKRDVIHRLCVLCYGFMLCVSPMSPMECVCFM